jgi:hypothetical protein
VELTFDRVLGILGIVLTLVLLAADKAGKLKGPALLVLLGLAALMTLPIALGNSWVKDSSWGMLRFSKSMFMTSLVAICYSGFAVWISPSGKEAGQQQKETEPTKDDAKTTSDRLQPHEAEDHVGNEPSKPNSPIVTDKPRIPQKPAPEVKTEESKSELKDALPRGPVAVYNAKGGEFFASCSSIIGPDGKAFENHGKVTLYRSGVNAPQPCSPSQAKASEIDGLISETAESSFRADARNEIMWTRFSIDILRQEFDEQVAKDFAAQPDLEKRIEFLKKLKASLRP